MAYKNLDLRRQRGRERYAKNREKRQQQAREYYALNAEKLREKQRVYARENRAKYRERERKYYLKRKEDVAARSRAYYMEHKEELNARIKQYHIEHYEELYAKRIQAKTELHNARQMCPAFKFIDKIRLVNPELYTTKYRIGSNLAHKAAKRCAAIVAGDYTLCPICNNCTISGTEMKSKCPMPSAFEFDGAISTIREHAADIVMANQK